MNANQLRLLLGIVERLNGHVNAVRFMLNKDDVDYAHRADEVEVSIHHGNDEFTHFSWDPPDGVEWMETL